MENKTKVILRSGKDEAIKRYHPWVFSGAIKKIMGPSPEGSLVEVFSNKDEYLGTGLYQEASIAVRMMAFAPERPHELGQQYWDQKLQHAFNLRTAINLTNNSSTNVYRLVHGEGDHLPGLIIDFYNGNIVMQAHATGIHLYRKQIAQSLQHIYKDTIKTIYYKSKDTLPSGFSKNNPDTESYLLGNNEKTIVSEHGNQFEIDFLKGQKTGFFIDQRENRKLLAEYAKGKSVLNTFCYSGGFSVYALKAGALLVHSLDSSQKALDLAEKNVLLNHTDEIPHKTIQSDTLQYLKENSPEYDLIILDPPAYAKHAHVRHNAVQGYKRLNAEAIKKIKKGGILFTFSCSQVVGMGLFKSTVISAAIQAGRQARILHQMTQPADHPINAFHPEGEYLKGLVLYID
ncbi:MAG: class I SAM-dependent rRNA methyltransferase [Bacteroidota bacterium]